MARHAHGTPTTQAQHAARTRACSCPASPSCQPRERSRLFPLPQLIYKQQVHWEAQTQHPAATGKLTPAHSERAQGVAGKATGKLEFLGDLLSVSFHVP